MEIKYESVSEWLNKITELREKGQNLLCADDPVRRLIAFSDEDANWHYLTLGTIRETVRDVPDGERIGSVEGRKALVEGK